MSRRKKRPSIIRRAVRWCYSFLLVLWLFTVFQVLSLRFLNPPFTAVMAWNWIKDGDSFQDCSLSDSWRPLNTISPHLRKAVLAGEDQRFLDHHGFDFTEISQAIRNATLNKGMRGASTITMQVARTVFLWPERSWIRKAAEAYYALLIETFWSKKRILEIYLNTVDWGTGVMGAEAASQKYYKTSASFISPSQAAFLTAILPNPHRWSPTRPNSQVVKRKNRILKDMKKMPLLV